MAATRAQAEASKSTPASTPAKDVRTTPTAAAAALAASTPSSVEGSAPARRTTTRTRKIPSRLLPSPSPPPSRPSSYHNPSKAARSGKEAGASISSTPAANSSNVVTNITTSSITATTKSKKSSRHSLDPASTPSGSSEQAVSTRAEGSKPSGSALADGEDEASAEVLGLGKRKRRPSSMIQAPSTLTVRDAPSPAGQLHGKGKKRTEAGSCDNNQERTIARSGPLGHSVKGRGRLSKGGSERRSALSALSEQNADESDGGFCAGSAMEDSDMELDGLMIHGRSFAHLPGLLQDSELSPPPLLTRSGTVPRIRIPRELTQRATFTKGGLVSVSPECSGKKARFGLQGFGGQLGNSYLPRHPSAASAIAGDVPPAASLHHSWRMLENRQVHGPAPRDGLGPFIHGNDTAALPPMVLSDAGSDQEDDEEDFHQAMLDGDFDMFDSQQPELAYGEASDHPLELKGDGGYVDDTPATTPRSPQSHCDMSVPDSPSFNNDEARAKGNQRGRDASEARASAFASIQDAVFAHALPTTLVGADKPHQHAGSLTLSLPYSPEAATPPSLRNVDAEGTLAVETGQTESAADTFATPIVSRRLHVPDSEAKTVGLPMTMKLSGLGDDAPGASQFLQFSPGIEIDSPLLGPALGLDMAAGKASQPASPFIAGSANETALEAPAAMLLAEAEAETSKEASSSKPAISAIPSSAVSKPATQVSTPAPVPAAAPAPPAPSRTAEVKSLASTAMMGRRTAPNHPPPRHISFTVRSVDPLLAPSGPSRVVVPPSSRTAVTPPAQKATATATAPAVDRTPDLIYGGGSTSSEASSGSASPASRTESDVAADAEVESLLFGAPEKLDLRELDQVWGGVPAHREAGLSLKLETTGATAVSAPALRRAKVTRLHVDLTPK